MHMNKGNEMGLLYNTLTATEMSINPRLVHDKLFTDITTLYSNY